MLIDKPPWVEHGGASISSIDVHPDGTRFVTAGANNQTKIWNLAAALDPKQECDDSVHKLLATLADHFASVNVARFSRGGKHLATGADDKFACLYELKAGSGQSAFGSSEGPNVELWKLVNTLRAHTSHVTDLAWSLEDTYLATCSLDNTIVIWDPAKGHVLHTLKGHESYVKGVVWDPIGKYLASQSDDRSVKVWRVEDWAEIASTGEPFKKGFITMVFSLRLSWSPDGQTLAVVNSFDPPSHNVALLDRQTWEGDTFMVGHQGAVVRAAYSPKMFRRQGAGAGSPMMALATGSQDQKIAIWHEACARPKAIATKIFRHSVSDIAWTPDGMRLLACSGDGTVAVLHFDMSELGVPLTQEEVDKHIQELYGSTRPQKMLFAESAGQLRLEAAAENGNGHAQLARPPGAEPASRAGAGLPAGGLAARLAPANGIAQPSVAGPLASSGAGAAPSGTGQVMPARANGTLSLAGPPAQAGPSGQVPAAQGASAARPLPAASSGQAQPARSLAPRPVGFPPVNPAQMALAQAGQSAAGGLSRKRAAGAAQQQASKRVTAERLDAASPAGPAGQPSAQAAAPGALTTPRMAPRLLSVPEPQAMLSVQLHAEVSPELAAQGRRSITVLQAANSAAGATQRSAQCELACSCNGQQLWRDCLGSPALQLAGSQHFAAAALADGTLQVYTPGGRRMLPALQLEGPAAFLASKGWLLMAVAQSGAMHVWDLQQRHKRYRGSVEALLHAENATVVSMSLSEAGDLLAVLSNSTAYAYQPGMETWMCVVDSAYAQTSYSSIMTSGMPGDLERIQGQAQAVAGQGGSQLALLALTGQGAHSAVADRAHLEANMASALVLRSAQEYQRWLLTYVKHLTQGEGEEVRLRELCRELMGPVRLGRDGSRGPQVLGMDTRALLRDQVLRLLGANRSHQRLVAEFMEQLRECE